MLGSLHHDVGAMIRVFRRCLTLTGVVLHDVELREHGQGQLRRLPRKLADSLDGGLRAKACHTRLELGHHIERLIEAVAAVCQHAVDAHVHGSEHGQAADLAQTHKRALQVAWAGEPVQEKAVKGKPLEGARRASVLVAVLVERRFAGRIERQTARLKLDQHMLGAQLRGA